MLQLDNATPLAAAMAVFPNRDAVESLYVVVRGTFSLRPRLALADKPLPPALIDEYFGDPATSSLKYTSELHVGKPGTDVVLVGQAWALDERPVPEALVVVSAAGRRKIVRVLGDRLWRRGAGIGPPQPFQSMPLIFERAFGGTHAVSERGPILAEERNPIGVGFRGKRGPDEMIGQKLPNLEDPQRPLERLGDQPPPACFGFVAPAWLPRRAFAGTYDVAWQERRAPYLPADFDPRFFHAAAPELTFERPLQGGEPIEVLGASPQGALRFELPALRPRVAVRIAGATERPPLRLETVLIEPDENRVSLSWRAELPCDKKVLQVERVTIEIAGDVPTAAAAPAPRSR